MAMLAVAPADAADPATAFPPGIQPVYREIKDWLIACDNTRQCVAKYVLGDQDGDTDAYDEDAGITIARDAGPSGDLRVDLASASAFDPDSIRIDGAAPVRRLAWMTDDEGRGAGIDGADAMLFVRALRNAASVCWSGKEHSSAVSLRGLTAALIAMDEAQGRTGNASALARPGPRSAAATPPPVLPPGVAPGPKARALADARALTGSVRRLQAQALKAHECDQEAGVNDSADPLDAQTAIVLLGCGRFAYQSSVLAFVVPRDRPGLARPLDLRDPLPSAPSDPESMGEYVGGTFDPDTRVFATYAKGRGPADCGSSVGWTYDGRTFRLSSYTLQQRCGGGAGDWPTLFRTRPAPAR